MREILFRAKQKNWCELPKDDWWVEGDVIHEPYGVVIQYYVDKRRIKVIIDPATLCQFIGKTDKHGKKIWENDIIKHEISDTIGTVKWYQEDYLGWCVDDVMIDEQQFTDEMWDECAVIGNIFDHPELLKGETE